ncbi:MULTISPECIES: HEAT repeat domain-containing protein [unclassified Moorena]|uniref:HEAT repeat domain-containing protein n=1 Tax=unclassified Moorena TaxID=2683338 RepID=UPI0013FF576B|nr:MULTISPECIES: HEAT repeat domain-containing protein [unclassified Moorena]NEO14432.1 NACHT domain-containing protein [Moorena sp. SIO3E8]NEQ00844.1 NACHT domain-containing protein [Moorena sp. SIO3F7]
MVTWDPYLASIRQEYAQWWHVYTLTDVEDRKRKEQQATPGLFNFDLMVQTIKSEQLQRDQNREETERLPVLAGLRKYAAEHVLLVGRPGSGKSTALVRLLGDEGIQDKIPVLVELRYYQTSVLELVKHFLESHLGQPLDSKEIEKLLFDRQLLLLIDGVNELPSEAARLDLTKFRQKYQKTTPMIFTTRDLGVGGDLGIEKKLEMQPLSADQMSEFVRKYLPQQGEQMLNQLGDRLREFGQTPLLLMMLCALFQDKGEIPSNLGLVFRSFTQFYSKQIKQDVKVSDNESRKFWPELLEQLGFVMTTGDNPDKPEEISVAIAKTKAEEILTNYLLKKAVVNPNVCAKTWLDDLLNHHLIQPSGELIEFRHQLIQEYYTAEYLLKQLPRLSDQELQQDYLNYLKWTETLVLMLQLVDNPKQAKRVVRLGLAVDWQLGARLAGAVKPEFQEQTVGLVAQLKVPKFFKVELLGITESDRAIPELTKCLDDDDSSVGIMAVYALEKIGTEATIDPLIQCLDDDHHSVHRSAAEALGKIGIEATIDPLIKCLDDDHYNVRRSAASALGNIGTEAAINPLIKWLDDDHYNVRYSAALALVNIGTEATINPLIKWLDDDDYNMRISAASALGNIGTEAAINPLIKWLDDDHYNVRSSAALALVNIGTEATINPLIKWLDDDHYNVRLHAAYALGNIGREAAINPLIKWLTEAAINPLIKWLDDDHFWVRRSAASALGNIGTEAAINPLIKWLDDDHYNVRYSAALALVNIGREAAINPLIKWLDDDHYNVRRSAALALGKIGTEAAINPLIKWLDDDHYNVRRSAASALGNIGTEVAIDPLIKWLDDDHSWVRRSAAFALGKIGTEVAIDPLIKCLDDDIYDVRSSAAEALGKIGTEVAIDPLIKCLDDDIYDVRSSAASALGKIGTEATIDPLIKWLDDDDSSVRYSAASALGKIGTEATIPKLINLLNNEELAATNDKDTVQETIKAITAIQERYQVYNPTYRPKPIPKPDPPKFITTQTIYILHLSDLHITTPDQATLCSNQLAQDLKQDLEIPKLDALILSGDIANKSTPDEYQAAQQFIDNLRQDFPLDPKQIVLVPGNHDLNWELAEEAYELQYRKKYHGELKEGHYIKVSEEVIEVRDEAKYQQRFAHFSQFYQAIKTEPYPLDYDEQGIIDYFPNQNVLILGLNSAWQLDHHFKDRASIHSGALSKALSEIRRNKDYRNWLKIAVWHHPLNSVGSDRITDQGFMERLAVAEFRLFLHGHIHKAQASVFSYDKIPGGRKLDGICAGTFSAPTFELRSAYPWQYNLLTFEGNQLTVRTRRREEANGAWKPDSRWTQGPGLGSLDYYSIDL